MELRVGRDPRVLAAEAPRFMEPRVLSPTARICEGRSGAYRTELAEPGYPYSTRTDREVVVLHQEVAHLEADVRQAASLQALNTEIRNRESEVAPLRSSVEKLAEHEAVLRADECETRSALVETRRSLAEERHYRQDEVSNLSGRVNEVRKQCDDRTARETQIREVQLSELDNRFRGLLNEEKQQRITDHTALSRQVEEESRTRQSETQLLGNRMDELREAVRLSITEESRTRFSETQTLSSRVEELQGALRTGLDQAARARETIERAIGERLAALDGQLRHECSTIAERQREECSLREAADRDAEAQRVELRERTLRTGEALNELRVQTGNRFDEERRERVDELRVSLEAATAATDQALEAVREQRTRATDQGLQRLESIVRDQVAKLESVDQAIAARMAEHESAMRTESSERVDNDRALAGRLAEFDRDLHETNSRVSQNFQRLEELPQLRDALQGINSERAADRAALETMCRDQQSQVARLNQKVGAESKQRAVDDRRIQNNTVAEKGTMDNIAANESYDRRAINNLGSETVAEKRFADGNIVASSPWRLGPERDHDRILRPLATPSPTVSELRARTPPPLERRALSPANRQDSTVLAAPGIATYNRSPSRTVLVGGRWAS